MNKQDLQFVPVDAPTAREKLRLAIVAIHRMLVRKKKMAKIGKSKKTPRIVR